MRKGKEPGLLRLLLAVRLNISLYTLTLSTLCTGLYDQQFPVLDDISDIDINAGIDEVEFTPPVYPKEPPNHGIGIRVAPPIEPYREPSYIASNTHLPDDVPPPLFTHNPLPPSRSRTPSLSIVEDRASIDSYSRPATIRERRQSHQPISQQIRSLEELVATLHELIRQITSIRDGPNTVPRAR